MKYLIAILLALCTVSPTFAAKCNAKKGQIQRIVNVQGQNQRAINAAVDRAVERREALDRQRDLLLFNSRRFSVADPSLGVVNPFLFNSRNRGNSFSLNIVR